MRRTEDKESGVELAVVDAEQRVGEVVTAGQRVREVVTAAKSEVRLPLQVWIPVDAAAAESEHGRAA